MPTSKHNISFNPAVSKMIKSHCKVKGLKISNYLQQLAMDDLELVIELRMGKEIVVPRYPGEIDCFDYADDCHDCREVGECKIKGDQILDISHRILCKHCIAVVMDGADVWHNFIGVFKNIRITHPQFQQIVKDAKEEGHRRVVIYKELLKG